MAQKSASSEGIEALIRRSEAARRRLACDYATFRHRIDLPARVKDSLRNHPLGWVGGSLTAGLLASTLLRTKPKEESPRPAKRRRGLAGFALTAATAVAKPMIRAWLTRRLQGQLADRFSNRPPGL
jgi:hypothetical protein